MAHMLSMSIKRSSSKGKVEVEVDHSAVMVDNIWLIPHDHLSASCGVHGVGEQHYMLA